MGFTRLSGKLIHSRKPPDMDLPRPILLLGSVKIPETLSIDFTSKSSRLHENESHGKQVEQEKVDMEFSWSL